jgi:hypothetical protein
VPTSARPGQGPRTQRAVATALAVLAALGCSDGTGASDGGTSAAYFINGASVPVRVLVNGVPRVDSLPPATISREVPVGAGSQTVEFRALGSASESSSLDVAFERSRSRYVAVRSNGSQLTGQAIADTGSAPVDGASKLRVVHLAGNAGPLDIWVTRPTAPTPARVLVPFPYGGESAYLQSSAGTWEVIVSRVADPTPENPRPVALATIAIIAGDRSVSTVVALDSPGNWVKLDLLLGTN